MLIRPQYDDVGTFMGFSVLLADDWSAPRDYKALMLAIRDSGSDPIYIPPKEQEET